MRLRAALAAALLPLALSACGSDGDGDGDAAAPPDDDGGGVIDPQPRAVSGAFFLGSLDRPADGYEVWLLDHAADAYTRLPLNDAGAFNIPIERFVEGRTYSLHLVNDFRLVLDVDLSPALPGVQSAFRYAGGYGFDLGRIVVALTPSGAVDAGGSPSGQVGGGFRLDRGASASLSALSDPPNVNDFGVGSQIVALDPASLLYGHYLASTHPSARAQLLAESSRILVKATVVPAKVPRAFAGEGGSWLAAARLVADETGDPRAAPRWADTDYDLVGGRHLRASLFTGGPAVAGTILVVRTQPDAGPQSAVPKVIPRVLSRPPGLLAFSGIGAAPMAVDYTSTTLANGLTRPFCQYGNVVLRLEPPVAGGVLDVIGVSFDYFGMASGRSVALGVKPTQFPAAYRKATSTWDPATRTLLFPLDAADAAAPTQTITIPKDLLLESIGSGGVRKTRLRVHYRSTTEATEATMAVWLARDC